MTGTVEVHIEEGSGFAVVTKERPGSPNSPRYIYRRKPDPARRLPLCHRLGNRAGNPEPFHM